MSDSVSNAGDSFEAVVGEAYDRLPEWVRSKMDNVAVTVEDVVDDDTARDMGLESNMELLGLYRGVPLIDRDSSAGLWLPDVISLYRLPIEEEAVESGKSVSDVAYETLWHEVAHHFGLDEEAVLKRESEEFGS